MLIIAIMLVSYGVISYYLLPQAILTGDSELQTTLFNSIFIGMIVGGIILLVILQSRG